VRHVQSDSERLPNPYGDRKTSDDSVWNETLIGKTVTYHIVVGGRVLLIENVPASVNVETGGRYISPETVERLQQTMWE